MTEQPNLISSQSWTVYLVFLGTMGTCGDGSA